MGYYILSIAEQWNKVKGDQKAAKRVKIIVLKYQW